MSESVIALRAAIKEGLFGGASVQAMRELQSALFHAEDRLKTIERSKAWERRAPAVKVIY